jgi:hypothetical protein
MYMGAFHFFVSLAVETEVPHSANRTTAAAVCLFRPARTVKPSCRTHAVSASKLLRALLRDRALQIALLG